MSHPERLVLECLKYLDPKTLFLRVSMVCRQWLKAAGSEELWQSMTEAFHFDPPPQKTTWKQHFLSMFCRDHCQYAAILTNGRLCIFSCQNSFYVRSMPLTAGNKHASMALMSSNEVVICGGELKECGKMSILCDIAKEDTLKLPDMLFSRRLHSVASFRRVVYVFGGYGATSEILDLKIMRWRRIDNMLSCRILFNACRRGMRYYLCGGDTNKCEQYSIDLDKFLPLPFSLKRPSSTTSFIFNGEVIVISEKWMYYIHNDKVRESKRHRCLLSQEMYRTGNTTPAVYENRVYFSQFRADMITIFDMELYTVQQYMHPIAA